MLSPKKIDVPTKNAIDLWQKALRFAAEAHRGQFVPGSNLPYLYHITAVAFEVIATLEHRNDADANLAVQCALLHDVIEDTSRSYIDISDLFGKRVANGVLALTKNGSLRKAERMADSMVRIKEQPIEIWMVKMSDRIVNLSPPPDDWTQIKRKAYLEEAKSILHNLKPADLNLANRLALKIKEYEKFIL